MRGYGVATLLGQTRKQARADEMRFLREWSLGLPPMPGSFAAVAALAEVAELHAVTARVDELARDVTWAWLDAKFGGRFTELHMKSDVAPATKGEVCSRIGAEMLIDDAPANLATLNGTRGVLLGEWPWTRSLDGDWEHAANSDAALELLDVHPGSPSSV